MDINKQQILQSLLAPWLGSHFEAPVIINGLEHRVRRISPTKGRDDVWEVVTTTGFGSARYMHRVDFRLGTVTTTRQPSVHTMCGFEPDPARPVLAGPTISEIFDCLANHNGFASGLQFDFGESHRVALRLTGVLRLSLEQIRLGLIFPNEQAQPLHYSIIFHPSIQTGWWLEDGY